MYGTSSWRQKYRHQEHQLLRDATAGDGTTRCTICQEVFTELKGIPANSQPYRVAAGWIGLLICYNCDCTKVGREAAWPYFE
jgi:hypothetical protein